MQNVLVKDLYKKNLLTVIKSRLMVGSVQSEVQNE